MQAPKSFEYNGKRVWDRSQTALVEYAVWSLGEFALVKVVDAKLRSEFGVNLSTANVSNKLFELLASGRIERLARGVYRHVNNRPKVAQALALKAPLFDDNPAPERPSLFD